MTTDRSIKTSTAAPRGRTAKVWRKPAASPGRTPPAAHLPEASQLRPQDVLSLQRQLGNRAVVRMTTARQAEPEPGEALAGNERELLTAAAQPAGPIQRQPAEAPAVGLEGGEAGGEIEGRLAASQGAGVPLPADTRALMENGIGADFSNVRIHTDQESQVLNRQLGAQAFTHGADIYVGEGQYEPNTSDGRRLIAHELAHVVQQGASQVRRRSHPVEQDSITEADAEGVIRRKLAGTTEAVLQLGGSPSLKSKAKATVTAVKSLVTRNTTDEGSGKYAQIILGLQKYEALEAGYMDKRQAFLPGADKAKLFGELKDLELLVASWLEQNADAAIDPDTAQQQLDMAQPGDDLPEETVGQRRYHALTLLLPRLRHEQMEIAKDQFYLNQAWSDKKLDRAQTTENAYGGQLNRLDEVKHQGGPMGVFIWDKPRASAQTAGNEVGIPLVDPNAGARSVAMYQLAKLLDLGVNVIAKTEFATHTSATHKRNQALPAAVAKLGVRQEKAPGQEAAQTPMAMTDMQQQQIGGNAISLQDPVLQRSLNALQLIDAIAGQLDRHWHNYYIATDGHGHVQGVVGIDLDMAFAPDHRTVLPASNAANDPLKKSNFVGMPELVDSQFAQRIVAVDPHAVDLLLRQYLSQAEVAATLARLNLVKAACIGILQRNEAILPGGWGAQTAGRQVVAGPGTSYLGKMAAGNTNNTFAKPAQTAMRERIRGFTAHWRPLEDVIASLERLMWVAKINAAEGTQLFGTILDNYTATQDVGNARTSFVENLKNNPPANWGNLLRNPAADAGLLARCV